VPGVTTYKAVKVGNVHPADLVAISGIGGLGHLALQYAKIFGASVAAIDITDEKLELAKDLGADLVIDARHEDPAAVLQSHGGADVAIGLAVDPKSFATAYAGLRRGGRLVLVALPAEGTPQHPRVRHRLERYVGHRVDRGHPRRHGRRVRPARNRADPRHLRAATARRGQEAIDEVLQGTGHCPSRPPAVGRSQPPPHDQEDSNAR